MSRAQLLGCGLSASTISDWVAAGRLFRVHPGVYAVGRPDLPIEGRLAAALLYARSGAAVSHTTAAWWWGLHDSPPSRRIHVSAPGQVASMRDVAVHHPRAIDRVMHRRLPVTTPARTLLDLAGQVPTSSLRRALANAEYRRLLRLDEVEAVLGRGHPGAAALRSALERHRPQLAHTLSELEYELIELCERFSIPLPEMNVFVEGYKVDALWRAEKLVVEVDGADAHDTPGGLMRDRERDLVLRTAGFTILRYTWGQVTRQRRMVAEDLRQMLDQRRAGLT